MVRPRPGVSPHAFFCRHAQRVAHGLIGCLLVNRQPSGDLLWGVIVEGRRCDINGYRRRTPMAY
jgi:3-methyladenine DNA glycosylase Mpg